MLNYVMLELLKGYLEILEEKYMYYIIETQHFLWMFPFLSFLHLS